MSKTDNANRTSHPAPMPDPDQRILEKKPDEQTHSRLVEKAEKDRK
ncbi:MULTISPECIES: hypothetical protein [Asticcacaulis]|nr:MULTISPECIES: hypothetical protein [Asticcacaulis]MBP2159626.1 hypothetical protein [Asticcacaulis solisilvae]MDR6800547.1 hypothetical protein [Asticcacaulis sp. BE141]